MTRSAIKRAEDADPNLQRCLIENCSTQMAVQWGHVYDREEGAHRYKMDSLERNWGLIEGSLNLDTRRNVFFVGASLYELYRKHKWSLVPEEMVVSQFFYEGLMGPQPRTRHDFPKLQSQTFKYTFLPIKDMEDVCITRQSEDKTVTIYEHPFSGFPTITSHIHPTFVLLHLANALWHLDTGRYDAIVEQYPWLDNVDMLHTNWFAELPVNTFWPSPRRHKLPTTSQVDVQDDPLRTPPRRLRLVPELSDWQRLEAQRFNNPPWS
ncbi:hypothetical protein CVT24_002716, partial [Panaeolus cyanescens]